MTKPEDIQKAVGNLIKTLGLKEQDVAQLDILSRGAVRIFGIDRSTTTVKFPELKRWKRDRDNRIIREDG